MALGMMPGAAGDTLLEYLWANFIGKGAANGLGAHEDETGMLPLSYQNWEGQTRLNTSDAPVKLLQRLPSLGRWMSMGAEAWEELLDGIASSDVNGTSTDHRPTSEEPKAVVLERKVIKMILAVHNLK